MDRQVIDLSEQTFILINGPLIILNLIANIFYACCFIFPPCNTQRLKQPLKLLLGFIVCCGVVYFVSLTSLYYVLREAQSLEVFFVSWIIVLFYVHNSMTCSVWLNFYYYIQIVPAQRSLLIWIKRNIKSVIYVAFLFDSTFFLFSSVISAADTILAININQTIHWTDELDLPSQVCFFITKVHLLLCLCAMTYSSFSTASYLHRHIRSVAQGGGSFSNPTIQSQIRVTITGISQGVLYFLYATFYIFVTLTGILSTRFVIGAWICFTVTSLYISGTTINMGVGQAICRQRAVDVWKALKALCGVGMATHDVTMHSSQFTSGEIANVDDQLPV